MKNLLVLISLIISTLVLSSCAGTNESNPVAPIPESPVIRLISPSSSSAITDSIMIEVEVTDNKGVVKVEFFVNNAVKKEWLVPPYKYLWDVSSFNDSTGFSIFFKAYDADNNITTSNVLLITSRLSFICGRDSILYEGKYYNTVKIGSQCWLADNLDVGNLIDSSQTSSNNNVIEKYYYNNDPILGARYGALYALGEALNYNYVQAAQGICPDGWHIPTSTEYEILKSAVSNNGNSLKAIGQGSGAGAGTNLSGFSALLSGYIHINSRESFGLNSLVYLWSSSYDYGNPNTIANTALHLVTESSNINVRYISNDFYFCVRCVKNK